MQRTSKNCVFPICDAHVHLGHFHGQHFNAGRVIAWLDRIGISRWVFSSTSASGMPWHYVRCEYEAMLEQSEGRAYPLLWLTPQMLKASPNLSLYKGIRWHGIKIHGFNGWLAQGKPLRRVLSLAKDFDLPVVLHTGGCLDCEAGQYLGLCQYFHDVRVILAHGRPADQAIDVLRNTANTWVDSSFMPLSSMRQLILAGFGPRIIYGSDLPVPACYLSSSVVRHLRRRLVRLHEVSGQIWQSFAWKNAKEIFKLE